MSRYHAPGCRPAKPGEPACGNGDCPHAAIGVSDDFCCEVCQHAWHAARCVMPECESFNHTWHQVTDSPVVDKRRVQ